MKFVLLSLVLLSCHGVMTVEKQKSSCIPKIVVSTALVSNTASFGWVGKGSNFYNVSEAVKGYMIQVKKCDVDVSTYFCDKAGLPHYIDLVKYENYLIDSVVYNLQIK